MFKLSKCIFCIEFLTVFQPKSPNRKVAESYLYGSNKPSTGIKISSDIIVGGCNNVGWFVERAATANCCQLSVEPLALVVSWRGALDWLDTAFLDIFPRLRLQKHFFCNPEHSTYVLFNHIPTEMNPFRNQQIQIDSELNIVMTDFWRKKMKKLIATRGDLNLRTNNQTLRLCSTSNI